MNFADLLGCSAEELPGPVWAAIAAGNFKHRVPDAVEQDAIRARVAWFLATGNLGRVSDEQVRDERRELWERCYAESELTPPFLVKEKNEPLRFNYQYIIPESQRFEVDFLSVVRAYLFNKYFCNLRSVAEFGCGTGHNLLALARQQPGKVVFGLDWSRHALEHVKKLQHQGVSAHAVEFNLLEPNPDCLHFNLKEVGVLTVGALEQVGRKFEEFLCYLVSRQPPICIHLEPIVELYDEAKPFDQLAIKYHRARGYLEGYLPALRRLARYGLAEILEVRRIPFGSFYHEAYTYIVWRPTRG